MLSEKNTTEIREGEMVYTADGQVPYQCGMDIKFIAGLWRLQNKFPHKIQIVRDREFVIGNKLPHNENTGIIYYNAKIVSENCYGKYMSSTPNVIVGNLGKFWAYGMDIPSVRAFIGIAVYDKYKKPLKLLVKLQAMFQRIRE